MKVHSDYIDGVKRVVIRVEHHINVYDIAGAWARGSFGGIMPTGRTEVVSRLREVLKWNGIDGPEEGFDTWEGDDAMLVDRIKELFPEVV